MPAAARAFTTTSKPSRVIMLAWVGCWAIFEGSDLMMVLVPWVTQVDGAVGHAGKPHVLKKSSTHRLLGAAETYQASNMF
jgi:hypothetical protein